MRNITYLQVTEHILATSSMFCSSCSSQKLKNHDAGRQIYTNSPAWTLKGRLAEMQQNRSPGPVYDASRGYTYLEQVLVLHACRSTACNHHIISFMHCSPWAASKRITYCQMLALSCAQLHLLFSRACANWQTAVVPVGSAKVHDASCTLQQHRLTAC